MKPDAYAITEGSVRARVVVPIRIISTGKRHVSVQWPDGRVQNLMAGDVLRVEGRIDYNLSRDGGRTDYSIPRDGSWT